MFQWNIKRVVPWMETLRTKEKFAILIAFSGANLQLQKHKHFC